MGIVKKEVIESIGKGHVRVLGIDKDRERKSLIEEVIKSVNSKGIESFLVELNNEENKNEGELLKIFVNNLKNTIIDTKKENYYTGGKGDTKVFIINIYKQDEMDVHEYDNYRRISDIVEVTLGTNIKVLVVSDKLTNNEDFESKINRRLIIDGDCIKELDMMEENEEHINRDVIGAIKHMWLRQDSLFTFSEVLETVKTRSTGDLKFKTYRALKYLTYKEYIKERNENEYQVIVDTILWK